MRSLIPLIILVILIIVIGYVAVRPFVRSTRSSIAGQSVTPTPTPTPAAAGSITPGASNTPTAVPTPTVYVSQVVNVSFDVSASNYSFSVPEIRVHQGDRVEIRLQSTDTPHNLVVDGYNVATATVANGDISSVVFVADRTGTFQYYSSVGNERQMGLTGNLIVQ